MEENLLRELIRTLEKKLGIIQEKQIMECCCCSISFSQCHIITEIGNHQKMTLNELSSNLNADKSIMSRSTHKLIKKGMVNSLVNEKDRRYISLTLTDEGNKVYKTIQNSMKEYYKGILDNIPEEKRKSVLESLEILNEAITKSI